MFRQWLKKTVSICACGSSSSRNIEENDGDSTDGGGEDPHAWSRDLVPCAGGDFSMAMVQANEVGEDNCQVEVGGNSVFVGVYDGHGGNDASQYINDHLFHNVLGNIPHRGDMSEEIFRTAVSQTENGFMTFAENGIQQKPELGRVGSCCLAGFVWRGLTLYVANVGDSRAVMGYVPRSNSRKIMAEQLTRDHNARYQDIQQELIEAHPDDPQIVIVNREAWRVKGIIQVSRAIGNAYLKRVPFTLHPKFPQLEEVPPPFTQAVISSEPEVYTRVLTANERFVIFASHGFWELLTNQQAVDIVRKNPRVGIAKRLIRAALKKAAKNHGMSYIELQQIGPGSGEDNTTRRFYHDDITVIVIYLDNIALGPPLPIAQLSHKGFSDVNEESDFRNVVMN